MRTADPDFETQCLCEWLAEPEMFGEATELLNQLLAEDPEEAWLLIRRLVDKAETERALQCVAAGPLEDLLCDHGPQFIDRVESAAQTQQRFKQALAAVWGHTRMAADVRNRVSIAVGLRRPHVDGVNMGEKE